jgi:hypothetical protein
MRRAIVVAAHYPADSAYPNDPHWAVDAELVAARLAQYGYGTFRVPAEQGLEGLREQLRTAPREEPLLLYFAGYLLLTQTGEPALLLGGAEAQTLGLRALLHRVSAQVERAIVVLEVRAGSETESAIDGSDQVLLERALAAAGPSNVDLVVRLGAWGSAANIEARALYDVIGALALDPRAVTTRELVAALNAADPELEVRAELHDPPFTVLPERLYSATTLALKATPTLSITPKLGSDPPIALTRTVEDEAEEPPTRRTLTVEEIPTRPYAEDIPTPPERTEAPPTRPLRMSAPPKPPTTPSFQAVREVPSLPTPSLLRMSAPPKPSSASVLPSSDPPRMVLASSVPPPKPKTPRAEVSGRRSSEPAAPLKPMVIRVVAGPPPQAPRLEPPPPSWVETIEPEIPPPSEPTPETEEQLGVRLNELKGDELRERRIALCEVFLERRPESEVALEQLGEELARSNQWDRLIAVYDALLSLQTSRAAVVRVCLAKARLFGTRLGEVSRALPAIERATELEPKNAELQLEAAALYERLGAFDGARAHYLAGLRAAPLDIEVHHRLCTFFAATRDFDRAYQAAAVLNHLGGAGDDEVALYQRADQGALPRPARAMSSPDWMLGLEPGAKDPALTTLLELISDAAVQCFKPNREQIAALRSRVQLEDVGSSTTTLARSLAWTADLLARPRPALYVEDGAAPPAPLPIHDLAWVVGREFGRGGMLNELTFHWGRAIARTTGTARVLRLFGEPSALDSLLSACFVAVKRAASDKSQPVLDLALALRQRLGSDALNALLTLLDTATQAQWHERLELFLDEVVVTSNRAGLLGSGDPAVAAHALSQYESSKEMVERRCGDLFCYALSDEYAELRQRLGLRSL